MKRAIVIVMDGCGAGFAPDAEAFNDPGQPNTLRHVWEAAGGIHAPLLQSCGYFEAAGVPGGDVLVGHDTRFGRLRPRSLGGKDSVTGHWEMMGITLDTAFPTYPQGFPIPLVKEFERAIGTQTIGNRPASGTQIIADLGELHMDTGFPILYTSADSVFQIACHEEVVPIERLYEMCEIARELCKAPDEVQRVIARPFVGDSTSGFKRTERRKDYPATPPRNLVDAIGGVRGIGVVPELFANRGFLHGRRTQSNPEHTVALADAMRSGDSRFIFANFEDFDMLYGHRNDPLGFAKCLESFDSTLVGIMNDLAAEDLLILTADHGNDPTDASTDHSREYVPFSVIEKGNGSRTNIGDQDGFDCVGATVAAWLGIPWNHGTSLLG